MSENGNTPERKLSRTAWKPGQSGNPKGRPPKDESLSGVLRKFASEKVPAKLLASALPHLTPAQRRGLTWKQGIVAKICELALRGDLKAAELVFERIDGKVALKVDIAGRIRTMAEAFGMDPDEAIAEAELILSGMNEKEV